MTEPAITPDLIASHGLKPDEYQRILGIIGREPTFTELGIFSAMWNESHFYDPDMAFALTVFAWLCCVGMGLFLHEKAEVPIHHWVTHKTKTLFVSLTRQ